MTLAIGATVTVDEQYKAVRHELFAAAVSGIVWASLSCARAGALQVQRANLPLGLEPVVELVSRLEIAPLRKVVRSGCNHAS